MGKRRKIQILDWFFCFIPIEERKDIYDYYFAEVLCLRHKEAVKSAECFSKLGINIRRALAYTIREDGINTKIALKTHRRIVWWGIWLLLFFTGG